MRRLKDVLVAACFLLLILLIALKVTGPKAGPFRGAASVVDGDTIIMDGERLRLAGIDAPELHQTCLTGSAEWQCGLAARDQLDRLVAMPGLECLAGRRDKWRRLLVTCRAADIEINREMVLTGMAVDYGGYEAEAGQAKAEKRGLWASQFARPEDWRRQRKLDAETPDGGTAARGGLWDGLAGWLGLGG